MTKELNKRLDRLAPKPGLRVVVAPPGVDAKDWHRLEYQSDPNVIVISDDDADL